MRSVRRRGLTRPLCDRCTDRHEIGAACVEKPKRKKHCHLGAPEAFLLSQVLAPIQTAFGEGPCYLVGSVLERPDFRDVDVRMIISDRKWQMLFGETDNGELQPFWSLLVTALSEYIAKRTGLRIDFQIQSMTQANWPGMHKGRREPVGMFFGEDSAPEWSRHNDLLEKRLEREGT